MSNLTFAHLYKGGLMCKLEKPDPTQSPPGSTPGAESLRSRAKATEGSDRVLRTTTPWSLGILVSQLSLSWRSFWHSFGSPPGTLPQSGQQPCSERPPGLLLCMVSTEGLCREDENCWEESPVFSCMLVPFWYVLFHILMFLKLGCILQNCVH